MKRIVFAILFIVFACLGTNNVSARTGQDLIILDQNDAYSPILLADPAGYIHALWIHIFGDDLNDAAVMYSRFDPESGWITPVDVLVMPNNYEIDVIDAVLENGYIHLVVSASYQLYYSHAPVDQAGTSRGWSSLFPISATTFGWVNIIMNQDGSKIHIVYSEAHTRPGRIYHISSLDHGDHWSFPNIVAISEDELGLPINTYAVFSSQGRFHVAWSEIIEDWPPSGVYYTYSDDEGLTWSNPIQLAGRGYNWISIGIESDYRNVHLVWSGTESVAGKYHAVSFDSGETWDNPEQIFPGHAGFLGHSSFGIDSSGTLYMVLPMNGSLGEKTFYRGQIFLTTWQVDHWSDPVAIVPSLWGEPLLEQGTCGMVITQGNLLHLAWHGIDMPEKIDSTVFYINLLLNAPKIELIGSYTPQPDIQGTSLPGLEMVSTPTLLPIETKALQDLTLTTVPVDINGMNSNEIILFPVLCVVLLIGGVAIITLQRNQR